MIYSKGEPLKKVPTEHLVDELFAEIDKYYAAGKQVAVDEAAAAEAAAWLAEDEDATAMTPERLGEARGREGQGRRRRHRRGALARRRPALHPRLTEGTSPPPHPDHPTSGQRPRSAVAVAGAGRPVVLVEPAGGTCPRPGAAAVTHTLVSSCQTATPRPSGAAPTRTRVGVARAVARAEEHGRPAEPGRAARAGAGVEDARPRAGARRVGDHVQPSAGVLDRRRGAEDAAVRAGGAGGAEACAGGRRRTGSENGAWNGRRRWLASGSCSNRNVPRGPVTISPIATRRTVPRVAQAFGS